MRTLLTILAITACLTTQAQGHLPLSGTWGYMPWQPFVPYSLFTNSNPKHKVQVQPFASISAGYMFLGGGVSYLSAPVGLVVYRPLNNNFTTFAAATVAPTVFHFNSLLYNTPGYPGGSFTRLGVNAGVTGGVIYTNDAKTFSISGSITVERGSYPVYVPPATNTRKQY